MERIRQAVEKARRDRGVSVGGPQVKANESGLRKDGEQRSGSLFEYSQSRTIPITEQVCNRNRMVAAVNGHPLQDTYRMLRTRVLQEMKAKKWKTIAITSPDAGSGKTLTSINLAITIARDPSHTALLVDADLRRPLVHKYFEFEPEFGLNDYLAGRAELTDVLFHPDLGRLTVLPGRESITDSAELLGSEEVVRLLSELRSRYADRIVVLDISPVLSVDDALVLAPQIDCMLMVAESGQTTREGLARSLELLEGTPIIGTVLNKVSKKATAPY